MKRGCEGWSIKNGKAFIESDQEMERCVFQEFLAKKAMLAQVFMMPSQQHFALTKIIGTV